MTKSVPLESRVPSPLCLQYFSVYFCVSLDMKAVVCWSWLVPACKSWLLNFLAFCKPVESRMSCNAQYADQLFGGLQHSTVVAMEPAEQVVTFLWAYHCMKGTERYSNYCLSTLIQASSHLAYWMIQNEWMNEFVCVCVHLTWCTSIITTFPFFVAVCKWVWLPRAYPRRIPKCGLPWHNRHTKVFLFY